MIRCKECRFQNSEEALFCINCGAKLAQYIEESAKISTNTEQITIKPKEDVSPPNPNTGEINAPASSIKCYKCNSQEVVGTCTKDNHSFCAQHGATKFQWGYCGSCIDFNHNHTPVTFKIMAWIFYISSIGLLLFFGYMVLLGGSVYSSAMQIINNIPGAQISGGLSGLIGENQGFITEFILPTVGILIGAIVSIVIGKQLSNGSTLGMWFLLLILLLSLFLRLWLLSFILIVVDTLNFHWFIMQFIPLQTSYYR